jgi:hypothetical protein
MVSRMFRMICAIFLTVTALASADDALRPALETTYNAWRDSIMRRDAATWQRVTAGHRRMEIRNRIVSEKRAFPAAVFDLPAPPPTLNGLKFLEATQNGPTAKASYFGKIDFGVGGTPSDNLLVLSFVRGDAGWLYDRADFVNLSALPDVRKELAAGNLKYLKETPEARPSGVVPPTPIAARPAKHIAKVYVFCPGRGAVFHQETRRSHRQRGTGHPRLSDVPGARREADQGIRIPSAGKRRGEAIRHLELRGGCRHGRETRRQMTGFTPRARRALR